MIKVISHVYEIGKKVKEKREELGYSQDKLADECAKASGNGDVVWDREKIAKIEGDGKEYGVREITPEKLEALACALGVSEQWLRGGTEKGMVYADPLLNPRHALEVLDLLSRYGKDAKELLGWARFLPCSLETQEFMEAHHASLFKGQPNSKTLIETYNGIGKQRLERLRNAGPNRPWVFYQLMFATDIRKIAEGTGEYVGISQNLRQACLQNLIGLIENESWKIHLIIDDDSETNSAFQFFLQLYDSLVIFDKNLAIWRTYSGANLYSTHQNLIDVTRQGLELFRKEATYRNREDVLKFLRSLCQS